MRWRPRGEETAARGRGIPGEGACLMPASLLLAGMRLTEPTLSQVVGYEPIIGCKDMAIKVVHMQHLGTGICTIFAALLGL